MVALDADEVRLTAFERVRLGPGLIVDIGSKEPCVPWGVSRRLCAPNRKHNAHGRRRELRGNSYYSGSDISL